MLTSLTLAAAMVAAPVPRDTKPAGPAPRVLEFTTDGDGKARVAVVREVKRKVQLGNAIAPANGGAPAVQEREYTSRQTVRVELTDLKDLVATTVGGKDVDVKEAAKRVSGGAVVLASADGNPVDPKFLKLFQDDVLVLKSPDLIAPAGTAPNGLRPGLVQPLPGVIQGAPGGIQIQILPAGPAVLPVAPPQPAPAQPEAK